MWPRFTLKDMRVIGHYLGVLVLISSVMYIVPLIVACACQEWEAAARYLFTIGVVLIAGSALRFMRIEPSRLNRQQAMAITGLAWIVLALFATIPLFLSGHYATYLDAVFDGVSGLTTTGATTIIDLDHLSNADNMLRFMMHLAGGLGLIVVALSLGLFGKAGMNLYQSEARSEHVVPNIVQTAKFIARIAMFFILVGTILITIICLVMGMQPARAFFHALWLSISGFVTGGFAPTSQSIMYYHSFPLELILMVLMLLGAINFVLHSEVWKGRLHNFFADLEITTMVIWLCVVTLVFAASMSASTQFGSLPMMLRRGLFMVISAFTTTGFQNVTTNQLTTVFTSGAFLVIAFIMAVGAGTGSTAGGIKLNRVGILAKSIVSTIKEAISPDSARVVVTYFHIGRHTLQQNTAKSAMTVFVLFIITYASGALVGIAHGYEATQAIFDSVAMASNGGLATIVSSDMPATLELFYIIEMWAGRLEFVTFAALIVELAVSVVPHRSGPRKPKGAKK